MSWHCSQELAGAYSGAKCSDGAPSAQSRSTRLQEMFCSIVKAPDTSIFSPSGMTCGPSTESHGEDWLTSLRVVSHARTSALPEQVADWMECVRDSGRKWRELWGRFDPDTSSWKTARCLFDGDLTGCSSTLPKWGMTRRGECWELTTPEPLTAGKGSGYLPTPTVSGNHNAPKPGTKRGTGLATAVKRWPTPVASCANQSYRGGDQSRRRLDEVVANYPTPTATMYKGWSLGHNRADTDDRLDYTIERQADHGSTERQRLNPDWVEWLMGWPVGWTDIDRDDIEIHSWASDPADTGEIPRTTTRRQHRAKRLICLGNGQVPQAMALAWETLNAIKEATK